MAEGVTVRLLALEHQAGGKGWRGVCAATQHVYIISGRLALRASRISGGAYCRLPTALYHTKRWTRAGPRRACSETSPHSHLRGVLVVKRCLRRPTIWSELHDDISSSLRPVSLCFADEKDPKFQPWRGRPLQYNSGPGRVGLRAAAPAVTSGGGRLASAQRLQTPRVRVRRERTHFLLPAESRLGMVEL